MRGLCVASHASIGSASYVNTMSLQVGGRREGQTACIWWEAVGAECEGCASIGSASKVKTMSLRVGVGGRRGRPNSLCMVGGGERRNGECEGCALPATPSSNQRPPSRLYPCVLVRKGKQKTLCVVGNGRRR